MIEYSNVRYLLSKRPIDDRAINRNVAARLAEELGERARGARPLRVLELGAGVGTMVSRLAEWGLIRHAEYTLVDRDGPSLAAAREHLARWSGAPLADAKRARFDKGEAQLDVELVTADLLDFLHEPESRGRYDLVVANAVLDLFDLEPTLPKIWSALAPGGAFWFTINFDGETIFVPELPLDEVVMRLYHGSMGVDAEGSRAGHSRTGRRLLAAIPASGARLLAAGSSDWVVFPEGGGYGADAAYFLHHIVQTIWTALSQHPELDRATFADWVATRHRQIERAQLCYIAHQIDVMGRAPER